jgi:hypothetical protein
MAKKSYKDYDFYIPARNVLSLQKEGMLKQVKTKLGKYRIDTAGFLEIKMEGKWSVGYRELRIGV